MARVIAAMSIPVRGWFAAALSAAFLAGCSAANDQRGELNGRVLFQGAPVTDARVLFDSAEQGSGAIIDLDPGGRFAIRDSAGPGLPIGTYRVAVKPKSQAPPASSNGELPLEALAGSAPRERTSLMHERIPARFFDFETSGLTVEIKAGKNPDYSVDLSR